MRRLTFLLLILLTMVSAACGFKLRGSMQMPFESIYVDSQGFSMFDSELRRALAWNENVKLVNDEAKADIKLSIEREIKDKKILSLSKAGNVTEFELGYQVIYQVTGSRLVPPSESQEINVIRGLTYSDDKILAKEEEELLLYEEMQMDAVAQLLRRLVTLALTPK